MSEGVFLGSKFEVKVLNLFMISNSRTPSCVNPYGNRKIAVSLRRPVRYNRASATASFLQAAAFPVRMMVVQHILPEVLNEASPSLCVSVRACFQHSHFGSQPSYFCFELVKTGFKRGKLLLHASELDFYTAEVIHFLSNPLSFPKYVTSSKVIKSL